jgi:CRISPR-associated protein Cmr5
MKDLERARHAFACAEGVRAEERKTRDEYKSRAQALGPNIVRSGLAAAVTFLDRERKDRSAAALLLTHLSQAKLPGLEGSTAVDGFAKGVRNLEVDHYILATREALALCLWLRRAVQAWPDEPPSSHESRGAA